VAWGVLLGALHSAAGNQQQSIKPTPAKLSLCGVVWNKNGAQLPPLKLFW